MKQSPLVLTAFDRQQRAADAAYAFTQDASFFYRTHIQEPGWLYVEDKAHRYLVAPNVSEVERLFDGALSNEEAQRISGVETVLSSQEGKELLAQLATQYETVYTVFPDEHVSATMAANPASKRLVAVLQKYFAHVEDARPMLYTRRARKSSKEIHTMQHAADITIQGFQRVYASLQKAQHEYELEAELTYVFRKSGATGHAYDPIVAAGLHACTLHYVHNNAKLPKNGLVLIDAGAEVDGYCADVTRTYAIGTPTERQKAVHAAVETAHHKIIALLGPEKSVQEYHEAVDEIMKSALKSLGLYNKPEDYRTYFPHAISHGLGIDVHDPLGKPTHFKPGMVLTVEPGIYISEEEIGVRIEDDILITKTGIKNLTGALSTSF